jgi:outer membrane receptor protein involved in Fe transport
MTADIFGVNKSYALLPGDITEEIKGAVDLNISAMYVYSKYFNIFVNVNNIANYKYQRYYNYPSYGIQALAGLSFSF